MPRLVYKPPGYSLHKASGQARVKFNGKTTYLGKFGSPESHQRYALSSSLRFPSWKSR